MGFFTSDFMNEQRTAVKDKIAKMQYEYGGTWNDATITSAEIDIYSVVVRATIPATAEVGVITGIRLLDSDDTVLGTEEINIPTSTNRGKVVIFRCPVQEV